MERPPHVSPDSSSQGDVARQAVDSLRGYAYQLVASAHAWLNISDDELLEIEVAEDYSLLARDCLVGAQVKLDPGRITLNSSSVADTINALFVLRQKNPDRQVRLLYLTTACIGTERSKADRVGGMSGLEYWRKVAAGDQPVAPLRARLRKLELSDAAGAFLNNSSDDDLIKHLASSIEWVTGQDGLEAARKDLTDRVIEIGDQRGLAVRHCEELAESLVFKCLEAATAHDPIARRLRRADFLRLLDQKTTVTVQLTDLTASLGLRPGQNDITPAIDRLVSIYEQPLPDLFTRRSSLVQTIQSALANERVVWIYGLAGNGKTLLARDVAEGSEGAWRILRLRDAQASDASAKLQQARANWPKGLNGLVIDDLDQLDDQGVIDTTATLLSHAKTSKAACIVTTSRRPSAARMQQLGCGNSLCIEAQALSDAEVHELTLAAGGPDGWSRFVMLATAGQPLLVQAFLQNLSDRGWPSTALKNLEGLFSPNPEIDAVRQEARRRLVLELPADARTLLYRASLLLGGFDRGMLDAVASADPALRQFGESLDALVGPWIERTEQNAFRLTPLVSHAGDQALSDREAKTVHRAAARYLVKGRSIAMDAADAILLHGLLGDVPEALFALVSSTLQADDKTLAMLSKHTMLGSVQTEKALAPSHPVLSAQLRVQQVLISASAQGRPNLTEKWQALQRELEAVDDEKTRASLTLITYTRTLMRENIVSDVPDFIGCISEMPVLAELSGVELTSPAAAEISSSGYIDAVIFCHQLSSVEDVALLETLLSEFCALPKSTRDRLKTGFYHDGMSPELAIKSAWARTQSKPDFDHAEASDSYTRLAKRLIEVGESDLAAAAYETVAAIRDEALADSEGALAVLTDAMERIGETGSLIRAKSRILMGRKNYAACLPLLETCIAGRKSTAPVENTYDWRDVAICRAHLDDWAGAADAFQRARNFARTMDSENMRAMELGLMSDEAVACWLSDEHTKALGLLETVYDRLTATPDAAGLRSEAVRRLFGHTVYWISERANPDDLLTSEFEHAMIPGANSNPTPHPSLADRSQPDPIMLIYLLAQAERASTGPGALNERISKLSEDEACLSMEAMLGMELWRTAMTSLDVRKLAELAPIAVDLECAVRTPGFLPGHENMSHMKRGKVTPAPPEQFDKHREQIQLDLAAVVYVLAMKQRVGDAHELVDKLRSSKRRVISAEQLNWFDSREHIDVQLNQQPFACAARLSFSVESGDSLTLEELLVVSLRFLEIAHLRNYHQSFGETAVAWAARLWPSEMRRQSFALRQPPDAISKMDDTLKTLRQSYAGLAQIIKGVAPYLKTNLGSNHQDLLEQIAEHGLGSRTLPEV